MLIVLVVQVHLLVPLYVHLFAPLLLMLLHLTFAPAARPLLLVPLHLTFVVILQNDMKHLKTT
jgi:hypothetical protein